MATIHPTAIVDPAASIDDTVVIGPYCVIGAGAILKAGVELKAHVVIDGHYTEIGENTVVYSFSSIGSAPMDLKYNGEPSKLVIGKNNIIREHVTVNPGTEGGGMLTRLGDGNLLMVGAHVGHDCLIGNNCILVKDATLGGHVEMDDFAIIGGMSAVHQFVRIGTHAMVGGMTGVEQDIIPYGSVTGNRASLQGLNLVGLKRRGFARSDIHALRNAWKELFESDEGNLASRTDAVADAYPESEPVAEVLAFLRAESKRGICTP